MCQTWSETQIVGFLMHRLIYVSISDPDGETTHCPNGTGSCVKVSTGTGNQRSTTTMTGGSLTDNLRLATDKRLTLHYGSDSKPEHCTYPASTTINFVCPERGGVSNDQKLLLSLCQSNVHHYNNCKNFLNFDSGHSICILTIEKGDFDQEQNLFKSCRLEACGVRTQHKYIYMMTYQRTVKYFGEGVT